MSDLVQDIQSRVMTYLTKKNVIGKTYEVSLVEKEQLSLLKHWKLFTGITLFLAIIGLWLVNTNHTFLGLLILVIGFGMVPFFIARNIKNKFFKKYRPYERELQRFLYDNGFFDEDGYGKIWRTMSMTYCEQETKLHVLVNRDGGKFQKYTNQLGDALQSALSMKLYKMNENIKYVEYIFLKVPFERKHVTCFSGHDDSLKIKVHGDFTVDLRKNFSMIIAGSSGSGKSYFTYYYLTEFISQFLFNIVGEVPVEKHARIFAIDPKQSDLYKLFKVAAMPEDSYGYTNADAFRIVRAYKAEMESRMAIYAESQVFNSVGVDLGLEPMLLVIEEYSSIVANMDSKTKTEFEDMVTVIAQKGRQLSMGLTIIMQQPRANSLSTNVREQLQSNAVYLGMPTRESATMMFGTTNVPLVSGIGVGMYSIERAAPVAFESPTFDNDVFDTILPVWKDVANGYKVVDSMERAQKMNLAWKKNKPA